LPVLNLDLTRILHEWNDFLADMAKRLVQDQSEHSLSYGLNDLGRGLKTDSSENRSGKMWTIKAPRLVSVKL
jgi:hypothetical protein